MWIVQPPVPRSGAPTLIVSGTGRPGQTGARTKRASSFPGTRFPPGSPGRESTRRRALPPNLTIITLVAAYAVERGSCQGRFALPRWLVLIENETVVTTAAVALDPRRWAVVQALWIRALSRFLGGRPMKNLLAFLAAAVIMFGGVGWYLDWFQ